MAECFHCCPNSHPPTFHSHVSSILLTRIASIPPNSTTHTMHEQQHQAARVEQLWQQFFSDPSQWWDERFDKRNSEAPDFKQKINTNEALWINDKSCPSWLQPKLATLSQQIQQQPSPSSSLAHQNSWGQAFKATQLWEEFFSDPSQWWDYRIDKKNARFPDFKHKTAPKALWIDNTFNPPWVHVRLAAIVQGQEQGQSSLLTPEVSGVAQLEHLWKEFFSDPSQWWDTRFVKKSPNYPDFKHKSTHEGLWIEDVLNPPWVKAKMVNMAMIQIESGGGLKSWVPDSLHCGGNISKLCQDGRLKEALLMLELIVQQDIQAPISTYICLLKGCTKKKALAKGKQVHSLIIQCGLDSDIFLGSTLVDMYAKCGSLSDAWKTFNTMPEHNVFTWNAIISAYVNHRKYQEAIDMFQQMQQTNIAPNKVTFAVVLKACARTEALEQGRQLHFLIKDSGFESDVLVGSALVDMYAKCECIGYARQVFNNMESRNVVSWNAMMAGYAQQGLSKEALALYEQMKHESIRPNNVTYVVLLKACASIGALEQGKHFHSLIIQSCFESDVIVGTSLTVMYAKCGCIDYARRVFNSMHERNVVSWNAMITGYALKGMGKEAISLYDEMKQDGVQPNNVTYIVLLKACARIAALEQGKQLHCHIIRSGYKSDIIVGNTLVDMYAKCGCIDHARRVFNEMTERDVVSWNVIIAGYVQQGLHTEALTFFELMKQDGVQPDNATYVALLKACASIAALGQGKQLHFHMIESGSELDGNVGGALLDMYAKCGCIEHAHQVLNNMCDRNILQWNALLAGYAKQRLGTEAFALYEQMKHEGVQPNNVTYAVLLKVCASIAALDVGKKLHSDTIRSGFVSDVIVGNTLVDMYAKCGCIEDACEVFNKMNERDVVSWNVMISGFAQGGRSKEALAAFDQMKQEGVQPDNVTYIALLKVCASIGSLEQAKQLHSLIIKSGFESDGIVRNALIDMYGKCGLLKHASEVFNQTSERDVVSWNTLIAGYAQQGLGKEALALYEQMKQEGVQPDNFTLVVLLKACASIAALEQGKQLHSQFISGGIELNMFVSSALVDLYAKCGCIEEAREVFNKMPERDVVAWNAMIAASAQQGLGKEALTLLEQMQREGVKPNDVTYVSVLSSCSRAGLIDEGSLLFHSMCKDHGVTPTMDHFSCMVDLLGRGGCLADAEDFINKMPIQPDAVVWMTLLGAARKHGQVEIGRRAFDRVVKLEPDNTAAYVLLSNVYAAAGRMDKVAKIGKELNV